MKRGLVFLLMALAGCGSDPEPEIQTTDSLATSALNFTVSAKGNGEAVLVSAGITATDGGARVLAEGERLLVSATDAPEHALSAYGASGYLALLPTRQAQITLTLVRAAEKVSADIELPPPFALTVPTGPVSAISAIPLSWEAADMGDAMTVEVTGSCVAPVSRTLVSDTGAYELQPGDLAIEQPGCEIAVVLGRTRSAGPLGLAASSSSFTSAQVRTAAIEVTP